jgi:hypothetical protein
MQQSPSWEANRSSATQEISQHFIEPEQPVLSWARSIQSLPISRPKDQF